MLITRTARDRQRRPAALASIYVALLVCLLAPLAQAESSLLLPMPREFGTIPALTWNSEGKKLGTATLAVERVGEDRAHIRGTAILDAGGRTRFEAQLAILDGNKGLRLLTQESQSHDRQGKSMGILRVDHAKGIGTCSPPPGSGRETIIVPLGDRDRVANIGLSLLFEPLAAGQVEEILFQILLCRDDPQVVDFMAEVVKRSPPEDERQIVEIRYQPDLGDFINWVAQAVIPDLAFWFDVTGKPLYVAHQMPLFADGPQVLILRDGWKPAELERTR